MITNPFQYALLVLAVVHEEIYFPASLAIDRIDL